MEVHFQSAEDQFRTGPSTTILAIESKATLRRIATSRSKEHPLRTALFVFSLMAGKEMLAAADFSSRGEPLKLVNGFPIVTTFINGQGPFRMLIDTGAVRSAVRRSVAVRAGLVANREVLLATMVGEKLVSLANAPVRVGSLEAPKTEILINNLPALDKLDSEVDGLLGQSFLSHHPYVVDYRAKRFWLGDEAEQRARPFGPSMQVELSSGRPVVSVEVDLEAQPFRLILDSGVTDLVLRCAKRCGTLINAHTVQAVTNAGQMQLQKGQIPVVIVGSGKFFRVEAVLMQNSPDVNNAGGSLPLQWFAAVYVNSAHSLVRFAR